ncbi:TetR/AcrR family transcriptional regulator [Haloglycomyces albus]|uniref:TetR/AcrR family transcriptional regulator n=1 Tax=Haloglycomyces albus TaxID=526067 RepID=UPI00146F9779|nr:TetR/AcrR family transcriptional regulator [Haloglycomyces albus]
MVKEQGLRERKKAETRDRIIRAAIELFGRHGFHDVTVAEIAEVAEVSKMTVFNYFGSKEGIITSVADRRGDIVTEVIASRPAGTTPVEAFKQYYLESVEHHDPYMGFTDSEASRIMQRLIHDTPDLADAFHRALQHVWHRVALELEAEGYAPLDAHLVSLQLMAVKQVLTATNRERYVEGFDVAERRRLAKHDADHAFGLLQNGWGDIMARPAGN